MEGLTLAHSAGSQQQDQGDPKESQLEVHCDM